EHRWKYSREGGLMSKRVLIVDDEEIISAVLQDFLEQSGYDVHIAPSLSSARNEIETTPLPDVVVVDMTLPDGSGVSLLHEMRTNDGTKQIPIILTTPARAAKVEGATADDKPDDCIAKPFNLKEFKARLEKQLHHKP